MIDPGGTSKLPLTISLTSSRTVPLLETYVGQSTEHFWTSSNRLRA